MPRILFILGRVHIRLPMLDAHAHGKGLGGHGHPRAVQHLHRVAGAVAQRQQRLTAGQRIQALRALHRQCRQVVSLYSDARQLMAKPDVRAQRQQLSAHVLQCDMQHIRSHMGLGVPEDVLRRTARHQLLHNVTMAQVLGAGVQLAVGKRACAAFTELDVGFGIQHAAAPEALHILLAALHALAPLQHDGLRPAPGQHQRREQARRPHAYHHRRQLHRCNGRRQGVDLRRIAGHMPVPAALQEPRFVLHGDGHGVDEPQAVTGVDGPAQYPQLGHIVLAAAQHGGGFRFQLFLPRVQRKLQALQPQHGAPPFTCHKKFKIFR